MSDHVGQIESKPSPRPGVPTVIGKNPLRVWIHGPDGKPEEIDLAPVLTQAIAHELWKRHAGNSVVNWIQAEAVVDHLADALADADAAAARPAAMQTEAKPSPAPVRLAA